MDDVLADVAVLVRQPGSRAERAQAVADVVRRATGCRWVGIYTVSATAVTNEAWSGPNPPAHPVFSVDQGLTSHAVRTAAIAVSNDVAADPRYLTNQEDSGSELIVPIVVDGVVRGTLDIEQADVGAFDGRAMATYHDVAAALTPLWAQI